MKNTRVVLKSEVLESGMGCPVCGGEKSSRARTCRSCFDEIGRDATGAVNAVIETVAKAAAGHQAALNSSGTVQRNQVWERPILAQVEIPVVSTRKFPNSSIPPYRDGQIPVQGGFVSLFVFGVDEDASPGDIVTALVELKTKVVKNRLNGEETTVHYLRAQMVEGVISNMELVINNNGGAGYRLDGLLPITEVKEERRSFTVGFMAVKTAKARPEDSPEVRAMLAELHGEREKEVLAVALATARDSEFTSG